MKLSKRQNEIIKFLQESNDPISGEVLGEKFGVSRQVIVKDIGMLKAFGVEIVSTNKGYKIDTGKKLTKIIESSHDDNAIKDELNTIVDNGGVVIDIFINHPVYGVIRKDLDIKSRNGVNNFVKNMDISTPLKNLTANVHYHTISAKDEESLKKIEKALKKKGYLK
ncbi:MAG: transcription repressor NadR [Anaerococcus sp.]|uniref:transcription repressor NadR n=1 Tax=Anaerococcus sp. TaxID=1872515 RepID=UPI0029120BDA|nr:transcription repressor NadR [Anaerococcus sp.]MDU4025964.1 transcription repressor NadR [Anaerococcus sp.]MDU5229186.1 transcription repressor NadR [Anaerococcus sp.]